MWSSIGFIIFLSSEFFRVNHRLISCQTFPQLRFQIPCAITVLLGSFDCLILIFLAERVQQGRAEGPLEPEVPAEQNSAQPRLPMLFLLIDCILTRITLV